MKYDARNSLVKLTVLSSVNPFFPNAPFLYPLKISENLTVF